MQRGFAPILVVLAVLAGAVLFVPLPYYQSEEKIECVGAPDPVGGGCKSKGWYFNQPLVIQFVKKFIPTQEAGSQIPPQKACTLEAKLCPDGTSVGRTGPNCDFSPCPLSPKASEKEDSPKESTTSADLTNWKTYNKNNISFQYPSTWKENLLQPSGSGFTQEIIDPNGLYTLTYMVKGNYNNGTGKAFTSLNEYAGLSYKIKAVYVDGQEAIQPLPRAGSENENAIDVFSEDAKNILTLELATHSSSEAEIQKGQKLFNQILSTFKFIE